MPVCKEVGSMNELNRAAVSPEEERRKKRAAVIKLAVAAAFAFIVLVFATIDSHTF